jgi:hypothetical protein
MKARPFALLLVAMVAGGCAPPPEPEAPRAFAWAVPAEPACHDEEKVLAMEAPPQACPVAASCVSCESHQPPEPPAAFLSASPSPEARSMRVHVLMDDDPFGSCVAHRWVVRPLPPGVRPLAFALRSVIQGPTAFERKQGLDGIGERSVADPAVPPLRPEQVRVSLRDGVATVDFEEAASAYLHQAMCARTSVASAIENTLLQFVEVREVHFAIGGEVISEWDA